MNPKANVQIKVAKASPKKVPLRVVENRMSQIRLAIALVRLAASRSDFTLSPDNRDSLFMCISFPLVAG